MKQTPLIAIFVIIFFKQVAYSQSVLLIGDSHTAGPFGQTLHQKLTQYFTQVVTLGHSSSAAYHWISDQEYKLSGGIFHKAYKDGQSATHPNPPHWRTKVEVPKFNNIISDNSVHRLWNDKLGQLNKPDLTIIALGANDANVISDEQGRIRANAYQKRVNAIKRMIDISINNDTQCIWIGPPNGMKLSSKNLETLYNMLKKTVQNKCAFMSSRHYKSEGCDGIHFSCSSQRPKALRWADETLNFILDQTTR